MQRLPQLDIIRGFAISGILLMNIFAFAYPLDYAHNLFWHSTDVSVLDISLYNLQTLLFSGRFLMLFNLLFGVSMLLIFQKYGKDYLQRRLYWLSLFGVAHGILLWSGDILLWYALTGLIVLKRGYLQLESGELWRKAIRLFAIGLIIPLLYAIYLFFAQDKPAEPLTAEIWAAHQQLWTGPYSAQVTQQLQFALSMLLMFVLSLYWMIAGVILLGASLLKSGWFEAGYSPSTTKILFWLALVISIVTVLCDHATGYVYGLNIGLPWVYIAMTIMALAFASILIHNSKNNWLQRWLAPCGRMAFTLYISQTLLLVLLFRVIQPDWFANLNRTTLQGIAIGTIMLQLLVCRWYFNYFTQGPLEWLWRKLSKKPAAILASTD